MSKRIEYYEGQKIGPYGHIYLHDVEPYIQPSNGKPIRQALFKCGFCGKEFVTRICYAKNGHTKSCGCQAVEASIKTIKKYNKEGHDAWNKIQYSPGDKVGDYGVKYIRDLTPKKSPKGKSLRYCEFKCPICGRHFDALLGNVSRGLTKGCGRHISYGEETVSQILEDIGINYEYQKKFDWLNGDTEKVIHPYYLDFYLPEYNLAIEYDGIQHFKYHEGSCWNDKKNYLQTKHRDTRKERLLDEHNVKLLRIPYTDLKNINCDYMAEKIKEAC